VEWRLRALDDEETELIVTESGIRLPEHFAETSDGWDEELEHLVEHLAPAQRPGG
jgi:hypothetical protein